MKKKLKTKEFKDTLLNLLSNLSRGHERWDRGCPRCGLCGLPHGEHPQPIRWTDRDTESSRTWMVSPTGSWTDHSDIGCGGDIRVTESRTPS